MGNDGVYRENGNFVTQLPLTDLKIRKLKQKDKPYRLSDGLGLYLQVQPTGSKLWQLRYQFMGKERLLSMGQYPAISLATAREKRDAAKKQLAEGIDPAIQKKLDQIHAETKARMTFKQISDEYYDNLVDRGLAKLNEELKATKDVSNPVTSWTILIGGVEFPSNFSSNN